MWTSSRSSNCCAVCERRAALRHGPRPRWPQRKNRRSRMSAREAGTELAEGYNFAYLDEQTKRMIRRALLKAVAVPGHQVPFASREMPLPYGWGTGGLQVTSAIIGERDTLKVIDQGSDETTNAVNIRRFFARTAGVATTTRTADASIVQ